MTMTTSILSWCHIISSRKSARPDCIDLDASNIQWLYLSWFPVLHCCTTFVQLFSSMLQFLLVGWKWMAKNVLCRYCILCQGWILHGNLLTADDLVGGNNPCAWVVQSKAASIHHHVLRVWILFWLHVLRPCSLPRAWLENGATSHLTVHIDWPCLCHVRFICLLLQNIFIHWESPW